SATWPGAITRYGDWPCHVECHPGTSDCPAAAGVTRLEFGSSISADPSTAWNAPAGIVFSSLISWSLQRESVDPWKNQFDPLSATIKPERCIAMSTTWVCGE